MRLPEAHDEPRGQRGRRHARTLDVRIVERARLELRHEADASRGRRFVADAGVIAVKHARTNGANDRRGFVDARVRVWMMGEAEKRDVEARERVATKGAMGQRTAGPIRA